MPVFHLTDDLVFPDPEQADPSGLLAVGGDLSPRRLQFAYASGIFPWYNEGEPILWWSPDPRFILFPEKIHVSRSMQKVLKQKQFAVTYNTAFEDVIRQCQTKERKDQPGTWITPEMREAYIRLHDLGLAQSVEAWQDGRLVGGMYGVSMGKCFFGESMFSHVNNASKAALITLSRRLEQENFLLLDCQVHTHHMERMGAEPVTRKVFLGLLKKGLEKQA